MSGASNEVELVQVYYYYLCYHKRVDRGWNEGGEGEGGELAHVDTRVEVRYVRQFDVLQPLGYVEVLHCVHGS